jgi:hypothetical protein
MNFAKLPKRYLSRNGSRLFLSTTTHAPARAVSIEPKHAVLIGLELCRPTGVLQNRVL